MTETEVRTDLPPDYYLDNFEKLLGFVHQQYSDILSPAEQAFFRTWETLSKDARMLYVRLISRKGPLFRSDKLNYSEILSIPAAAHELELNEFLEINPELSIDHLNQLLTKSELINLHKDQLSSFKSARKVDILEKFATLDLPIPSLPQTIYKPLALETTQNLLFLFFGNTRQNLTEFVLQDLGLTVYENYSLSSDNRLFNNREELEQGLQLSQLYDKALEAEWQKDSEELLKLADQLPSAPAHPVLYRRYCKLVNLIAREVERQGLLEQALQLFALSSLPPARERRARILEKQALKEQAQALCQHIILEPTGDLELAFAERFQARLSKQKRVKAQPIPENRIRLPKSELRVEQAVQQHFLQLGQDAHYVENSLIPGLTGLAFWDVIFAPVPGAFFHPFQSSPTDLVTPDFFHKRSHLISQRLEELRNTPLLPRLQTVYREKKAIANPLVNWSLLTEGLIELATHHIPVEHLTLLFRKLMQDIAHNRNGFPDLIVFDQSRQSYCWVEVKGPGDKLQENQKRWFHFFLKNSMPCEVLYVEWLTD